MSRNSSDGKSERKRKANPLDRLSHKVRHTLDVQYQQVVKGVQQGLTTGQDTVREKLEELDAWAVAKVNDALDRAASRAEETADRAKDSAQQAVSDRLEALESQAEQALGKLGKGIERAGGKLKDATQTLWKRLGR